MHKHENTGSKITWSSAKSASFNMHHPSSIASMTITISQQSIFNRFKNCIANRMSLPAMGANAFTALSAPFPARPKAVSSKRPVRNALRRRRSLIVRGWWTSNKMDIAILLVRTVLLSLAWVMMYQPRTLKWVLLESANVAEPDHANKEKIVETGRNMSLIGIILASVYSNATVGCLI